MGGGGGCSVGGRGRGVSAPIAKHDTEIRSADV